MKKFILLLIALALSSVQAHAQQERITVQARKQPTIFAYITPSQASQPSVTIEFRLAEDTPGNGLIEITVPNTDQKVYLYKEVIATNKDILEARAVSDPFTNGETYKVEMVFTSEAAERMTKVTQEHYAKRLAILIDGKLIFALRITGTIHDKTVISGSRITKDEAERIVKATNSK